MTSRPPNQFHLSTLFLWTALVAIFCSSFAWIWQPGLQFPVIGYWVALVVYMTRQLGARFALFACIALGAFAPFLAAYHTDGFMQSPQLESWSDFATFLVAASSSGAFLATVVWFLIILAIAAIEHLGPPMFKLQRRPNKDSATDNAEVEPY